MRKSFSESTFYTHCLKQLFLSSKQADKNGMKSAYSLYFHIRDFTEL